MAVVKIDTEQGISIKTGDGQAGHELRPGGLEFLTAVSITFEDKYYQYFRSLRCVRFLLETRFAGLSEAASTNKKTRCLSRKMAHFEVRDFHHFLSPGNTTKAEPPAKSVYGDQH
jgi:hypothetical protein